MRKKSLIISILLIVILITGCGKSNEKKLECTMFSQGTNMNVYGTVKYIFKDDIVQTGKVEAVFKDITLDNLENVWGTIKQQFSEQNSPVDVSGYKRSNKSDDKNYTFTVNLEIDYTKISENTINEYGLEDLRGKSYDEVKKITEESGEATCK